MHLSISMRVLGLLLMMFSSAMIPPLVIALVADDHTITAFLSAMHGMNCVFAMDFS
jgi:trk system potassium uptake protein TrkH